jgi:hypothetical protein
VKINPQSLPPHISLTAISQVRFLSDLLVWAYAEFRYYASSEPCEGCSGCRVAVDAALGEHVQHVCWAKVEALVRLGADFSEVFHAEGW